VSQLLELRGVSRHLGGLQALVDVTLAVRAGEIKAVIGPNGAGKSTLFNVITGVTKPSNGEVWFKGVRVNELPTHQRVRAGMARTFQNLEIFPDMTVLENVMVGRHARTRAGFLAGIFNTPASRRERDADLACCHALLESLGLHTRAQTLAGSVSYGEAKIMEIARAMASEPALLLLDEPMAGLPAAAIERVCGAVRKLNAQGVAILLVEHNVHVVMNLSHSITVLNNGLRISEGTPDFVRHDPAVLDAYLGDAHA
jgi:branched-chain amino acid transport system ATP-binding protein